MEHLPAKTNQDLEILRQIEAGELHPAMAAFGLWQDDQEPAQLCEEIYRAREIDQMGRKIDFTHCAEGSTDP